MDKDSVFHCEFSDLDALYAAYMPFVTSGGLFIRNGRRDSDRPITLGSKVAATLKLPGERRVGPVTGKIIWISLDAKQDQSKGIGIQFDPECAVVRDQIDTLLKEHLTSGDSTNTL